MSHWDDVERALTSSGYYAKLERERKRIERIIHESVAYWEKRDAEEARAKTNHPKDPTRDRASVTPYGPFLASGK